MSPRVPWSRSEPFGAWVRLDDATLLAVTPALASDLGVPHVEHDGPTRPLDVHMAVTARCPAGCEGCYLDARPEGDHPTLDVLLNRLRQIRDAGASTVAFGGGEPLLRRDLPDLAEEARQLGLVPVFTTSGIGLTPERARELVGFAQINVSYDGVGEGYEAVRGYDGRRVAERAIRWLAEAGIPVGINIVLTRQNLSTLEETAYSAADLGASELQLLRYKPAGRATGVGYFDRRLTEEQTASLWPAIERIAKRGSLSVRIDCALVALLSASLAALADGPALLERFGVFGCEAGRHLAALNVRGAVAPCSFAHPADAAAESLSLAARWSSDDELASFRAYHAALPEPCASCTLRRVCRGGCQVVSRHATRGAFAPDPECPRVRAYARSETFRDAAVHTDS